MNHEAAFNQAITKFPKPLHYLLDPEFWMLFLVLGILGPAQKGYLGVSVLLCFGIALYLLGGLNALYRPPTETKHYLDYRMADFTNGGVLNHLWLTTVGFFALGTLLALIWVYLRWPLACT